MDRSRYQYIRGSSSIRVPTREWIKADRGQSVKSTVQIKPDLKTLTNFADKKTTTSVPQTRNYCEVDFSKLHRREVNNAYKEHQKYRKITSEKIERARTSKPTVVIPHETVSVERAAKAFGFPEVPKIDTTQKPVKSVTVKQSSPKQAKSSAVKTPAPISKTKPQDIFSPKTAKPQQQTPTHKTVRATTPETVAKAVRLAQLVARKANMTESKPEKRFRWSHAVRYGIVAAILVVTGYLAYDTWTTNRHTRDVFSHPASAMTVAGDTGTSDLDETSVSNEDLSSYTVSPDMPRYITISKIGVKARVLNVGVTKTGQVDAPRSIHDTGWYNGSAKPGTSGAAFIDGHMAGANIGGVFDNLKKLNAGDVVTIELGSGDQINYKVANKETVAVDEVDMMKVLSVYGGGSEGLNLMTCAGQYNENSDSYNKRTIIYTVRE